MRDVVGKLSGPVTLGEMSGHARDRHRSWPLVLKSCDTTDLSTYAYSRAVTSRPGRGSPANPPGSRSLPAGARARESRDGPI